MYVAPNESVSLYTVIASVSYNTRKPRVVQCMVLYLTHCFYNNNQWHHSAMPYTSRHKHRPKNGSFTLFESETNFFWAVIFTWESFGNYTNHRELNLGFSREIFSPEFTIREQFNSRGVKIRRGLQLVGNSVGSTILKRVWQDFSLDGLAIPRPGTLK